jgi:hypothetical protein
MSRRLAEDLADIPHYDPKHRATNFWKVVQHSVTQIHDYEPFWSTLGGAGLLVPGTRTPELRAVIRGESSAIPIVGKERLDTIFTLRNRHSRRRTIYYSKWQFDPILPN